MFRPCFTILRISRRGLLSGSKGNLFGHGNLEGKVFLDVGLKSSGVFGGEEFARAAGGEFFRDFWMTKEVRFKTFGSGLAGFNNLDALTDDSLKLFTHDGVMCTTEN